MAATYSNEEGISYPSGKPQVLHTEGHLDEKVHDDVQDGDDALKILHTHYEPYSQEEEKRVLRKIDLRLIVIMLLVNGLQFVDKNVRLTLFGYFHSP